MSSEIEGAAPARSARRRRASVARRRWTATAALITTDTLAGAIATALALLVEGAAPGFGAFLIVAAVPAVAAGSGLYARDARRLHRTTLDEIPQLFHVATLIALAMALGGSLIADGGLGAGPVALGWVALTAGQTALRSAVRHGLRVATPAERCLLVGDPAIGTKLSSKLDLSPSAHAELVGVVPTSSVPGTADWDGGIPEDLRILIERHDIDRVILAPAPLASDEAIHAVRALEMHGVRVSLLPMGSARLPRGAVELDELPGLTLVGITGQGLSGPARFVKRSLDVIGAGTGLIVLSPLFATIALAVRLETSGPVLFRQQRGGRNGAAFEMRKFRTMVEGAERMQAELAHRNEAEGVFKITDDPRITRVGRVLRQLSIDELPQLINVLRGDMSLVGPRPLPLHEDRAITGWHRQRELVRPGVTGPWQLLGSRRVSVREMIQLDSGYIAGWSFWGDVKLLLQTIGYVVGRRGV